MDKNSKHDLGYRVGQIMALIACLCVSAIAVALTVKFIMWIL